MIAELERLENFNIRGNKIDPRLAYLPQIRQQTINNQTTEPNVRLHDMTNNKHTPRNAHEKGTIHNSSSVSFLPACHSKSGFIVNISPTLITDSNTPRPKKKFGGWFRSRSRSPEKEAQAREREASNTRDTPVVTKSAPRLRSRPPLDYRPTSHSLPPFFR